MAYVCCFLSYALNLFVEKVVFNNSHEMLHKRLGHNHEHEHYNNEEEEKNENNIKRRESDTDITENKEEKQVLDIKLSTINNEISLLKSKIKKINY